MAEIPGIKIDPGKVQTNILICDISGTGMTSDELSRKLAERNVLANGVGPQLIRFVTHLDVSREQCAQALEVVSVDLRREGAESVKRIWTSASNIPHEGPIRLLQPLRASLRSG